MTFSYIFAENSFSQRMSEIYENGNFGRFDVVLILEHEDKNW